MGSYWTGSNVNESVTPGAAGLPPRNFGEAFASAYTNSLFNDSEDHETTLMREVFSERASQIEKLTGQRLPEPMNVDFLAFSGMADWMAGGDSPKPNSALYSDDLWQKTLQARLDYERKVDELRKVYPQISSAREIEENARRLSAEVREKNDYLQSRRTLGGTIGSIAGQITAGMSWHNPRQLATTLITAPAVGVGGSIQQVAKNILASAAISAGTSVVGEFGDYGIRAANERLGLETDLAKSLETVGMAGAIGAASQSAIEGAARAVPYVGPVLRAGVRPLAGVLRNEGLRPAAAAAAGVSVTPPPVDLPAPPAPLMGDASAAVTRLAGLDAEQVIANFRQVETPTQTEKLAEVVLEREVELQRTPQPADRSGEVLVENAIFDNTPLPELPPQPVTPELRRVIEPNISQMSARDLLVDAERFQFKSGGDTEGVTERLRGVKTWNPAFSGTVMVWQDMKGTNYVADGHQRIGLARRLIGEGNYDDIKVGVTVYKETEGYTADRVRTIAAAKNIAEGSGTAVDAADIMRLRPDDLPELPPQSALVRHARELAKLQEDVFRLAAAGKIREDFAAVIGRLEPDQKNHLALADLIIKTEPETVFQAEQIVRQAREIGFASETQMGLFGEEVLTTSLFKERSKILERSLRLLREDARTFKTLTRQAETISAYGNVLNETANAQQLNSVDTVLTMITKLANSKGEISDALNAAAREYARTGKLGQEAQRFVSEIRRFADGGGLSDWIQTGGAGRLDDAAPPDGPSLFAEKPEDVIQAAVAKAEAAPADAEMMLEELRAEVKTEPTKAGEQTVIPGAEKISDKALAERKMAEPLRGGNAPMDSGLFDTETRKQIDLFGLPGVVEVDEMGKVTGASRTTAELFDDLDDTQSLFDAMKGCLR